MDINLRDESAGLEFTLDCDIENGLLRGWSVICINPLPLQTAFNVPFLSRQAGTMSPCAQKAEAARAAQAAGTAPPPKSVNKVRIGPDGTPVRG